MIVYGDRERVESASRQLGRIEHRIEAARSLRAHARAALVAEAGIEAGMLCQALLDREYEASGYDELTPLAELCAELSRALGHAFTSGELTVLPARLAALSPHLPEVPLALREPEGYAFYALYPEQYVAAARTLPRTARERRVIGIRSIGCSLAGFVAGALEGAAQVYTVRPSGHPFSRTLQVGPRLERALLRGLPDVEYLIVDEGPGLSGSSFSAVAEWLLARGAEPDHIVLLPSHAGEPGPRASVDVRARYRQLRRVQVPFERVFEGDAITRWFSPAALDTHTSVSLDHANPSKPTRELSAGAWRELFYGAEDPLPPSHRRDERRKYLLPLGDRQGLMKFIGLGESGRRIASRARLLGEHGFTPALEAYHHGFALFHFHGDARPLPLAKYPRESLVAQLSSYLAFLARRFAVSEPGRGARPTDLLRLAKYNVGELLDQRYVVELERYDAALSMLESRHQATATDNKLDAYEWLLQPNGTFIKCDAEGHHAAHDCIGCQDPAWDVAGAVVELALDDGELEFVLRALQDRAGKRLDRETLRFYELAYCAFRGGAAHYAELALRGWADDDAQRFAGEQARYREQLAQRLSDR